MDSDVRATITHVLLAFFSKINGLNKHDRLQVSLLKNPERVFQESGQRFRRPLSNGQRRSNVDLPFLVNEGDA